MEQTDKIAVRNLVLGAVLGVILSRFSVGSILMTAPMLLACPKVNRKDIKGAVFAAMLAAVVVWTLVLNRELLGTEYWPVILVGLYIPVAMVVGSAVWALTSDYSGSLMRRFFWACIPVFAIGVLMSVYFASGSSQNVRDALVSSVMYYFPSETINVDMEPIISSVVDSMILYFAPLGIVLLAFPVVMSDINVNRYVEQWQYDFANMKLPDTYVWVLFGSWAAALASTWIKAIPTVVLALTATTRFSR